MSEFEGHTPGPWDVDGCTVFIDQRYLACCGHGTANGCCGEPVCAGDIHEIATASLENARLIAAAPRLLAERDEARAEVERLREALTRIVKHEPDERGVYMTAVDIRRLARTALGDHS